MKSILWSTCSRWRGGSRGQQRAGGVEGAEVRRGLLAFSWFCLTCPALLSHGGENLLCKPDDSMEGVRLEIPGSRGWNPGEARPLSKQNMTLGESGRRQAGGYDYQGQGSQVPARVPLSLGRI